MSVTPTISSSSAIIGSTGNIATVSFTTRSQLPNNGVILLKFPSYTQVNDYIMTSSPTCTGISPLNVNLQCSFSSSNTTLIIKNILSSSQVGGVALSFKVDSVRNPYNGFAKTGFTLYTCDQYFGQIDTSTLLSFQVSTPAQFTSPTMQRLDGITTVGENSIISPQFTIGSMPIDPSCRLRIDFPSDMPMTGSLTGVTGSGLFQLVSSFTTNSVGGNYVEIDGCATTTTQDPADIGVTFLSSITNKGYMQLTNNFIFSLYAINGGSTSLIAYQNTGLTFSDFTAGNILAFNCQPVVSTVQTLTAFSITMQPQHAMISSSKIIIVFPSTITLTNGGCSISTTTGAMSTSVTSCNVASNTLTIVNPFGSSSNSAATSFSFNFASTSTSTAGSNPVSTMTTGLWKIYTYAIVGSNPYEIDQNIASFTNLYTATIGTGMIISAAPTSTVACISNAGVVLTIKPLLNIPAGGKLQITLPPEIILSGSALTACTAIVGGVTLPLSTSSNCVVSGTTITVSGAFSSQVNGGSSFTVEIDGITNPANTLATSSFTVISMDGSNNKIEQATSGASIAMLTLSPLNIFSAALQNNVNGATSQKIQISFTVNCPLSSGSIVAFSIPADITVPGTSCGTPTGTGLSSVSCQFTGNSVKATLTTSQTLQTGRQMTFMINGITNPMSTCITSPFTGISISDNLGNQINSYAGTGPTLQTSVAATTAAGSINQGSQTTSASTDYTFVYTTMNDLLPGSTFSIVYPANLITITSALSDCYVTVGGTIYFMLCTSGAGRTITVNSAGLTAPISAGTQIQLTVGPINNPSTQVSSPPTFNLFSFTSGGCKIDQVLSGLIVGFTCNWPCFTCSSSNKNQCFSCNLLDSASTYYFLNQYCYTSCPTNGYYADTSFNCKQCTAIQNCLTCASTAACTACDSTSAYKILYQGICIQNCPTGYYQTSAPGYLTCAQCDGLCATCNNAGTAACLSCVSSSGFPNYLASGMTCLANCPVGYVSLSNICTQCISPCATCATTASTCTSCITSNFLYGGICKSSCPSTTVAQPSATPPQCAACGTHCASCDAATPTTCFSCTTGFLYNSTCITNCPGSTYQSGTSCLPCDTTCFTCSGSANNNCVTCSATTTYPYLTSVNTCVQTCPANTIIVNGNQCKSCSSPCLTCVTSQSQCTSCISGYFFYLNSCVSSCPSGTTTVVVVGVQTCTNCITNCKVCSSSNLAVCTTCIAGYFLYNSQCINSCPAQTYQSGTNCLACDPTCNTCSGSANNDCLTCIASGTYPYLSTNQCVDNCPSGTISINNVCKSCTSPCLTCQTSQTQCLTCISAYYFYQNTCLTTCPAGTVGQTTVTPIQCTSCSAGCSVCSPTTPAICTTCKSGYILYNGNCVTTCPAGTYQPSGTSVCQACDTSCLSCSGTSTNCLSCNQGGSKPLLLSGSCISTCPSGYVQSATSCVLCTSPCLTCSVAQDNCLTCIGTYPMFYQNQCFKTCPTGTTASGSKCVGCTTSCLSCNVNASQCYQCTTGMYLYNNGCRALCPAGYKIDVPSQSCVLIPVVVQNTTNTTPPLNITVVNDTVPDNTTNSTDKPYIYFPIATSQTILGGITVGSFFKDPTSLLHSNTLAMWAPLEFIAYGGQAYLSYVQEVAKETQLEFVEGLNCTNSTNSTCNSTAAVKARRRRLITGDTSKGGVFNGGWPLVFYGTAGSFIMLIVTNMVWAVVHCILIPRDPGYLDHRKRHCCAPLCIAFCSALCSFKMGRMHHSRFFGMQKFSMQYENPEKVQHILQALTIVNVVLTLFPIVCVDIYGIATHKWGNQFYMTIIETLFLALCVIIVSIFEFKHAKVVKPKDYDKVNDQSSLGDDSLLKKLDDQIRQRLGEGLDDFLDKLKKEKFPDEEKGNMKGIGRSKSMTDLNREVMGEDDRVLLTEPLDPEKKKAYLAKPNPFLRDDDPEHPNNCYAEPGKLPKKFVDPANSKVKVIQTGDRVMDGDEYDREFEEKMRLLFGKKEDTQRLDAERTYDTKKDDDDSNTKRKDKKNKMRGRKDKYYEQVDNEDLSFAEDAQGRMLNDEDDDEELDKIEEESHQDDDDEEKAIAQQIEQQRQAKEEQEREALLEQQTLLEKERLEKEKADLEEKLRIEEEEENERQKELQRLKVEAEKQKELQRLKEEEDLRFEEEEKAKKMLELKRIAEEQKKQLELQQQLEKQQQEEQILRENEERQRLEDEAREQDRLRKLAEEEAQNMPQDRREDDLLEDKIMQQQQDDPYNPKFTTTNDMEKQLMDESRRLSKTKPNGEDEDEGEYDSDDDNNKRLKNMTDPNMRKFNVNDILGEFDRDDKGNLVMLQNKTGGLVDKLGNQVNEKGYLIDEHTGDVLEKEGKVKVFDKKDLDERGELPPPFNIERFNFNPHDIRGAFDRDPKTGDEIIGNRKNDKGELIDKLGRRINDNGWLVDDQGNLVDKRGRIKLHHKLLDNDGNLPMLFNYKGKKYDIRDVIGDFEKDRKGNIIIRRDKDNQMCDKKNRRVNNKGYLIDKDGNVINQDGKLMFENFTLSKDNEIPKFFPFLKFNVEDIKGEYEMDPLGNPMLQKNENGDLIDNKGRLVNEKGYLVDEKGNIKNKRGFKVFTRNLMEDDGEIPKVFRTGLFRKDTVDSFNQLMDEIDLIDKMNEAGESYRGKQQPRNKGHNAQDDENERIARRIEQIVEEDNDDDDIIMKEIEELANIRDGENGDNSEGGNTSVDSKMDITPSDYNLQNMRFMEQEQMKDRVRQQLNQDNDGIPDDEEFDGESEYMNMPGKKLKRRKKKSKKKKKAVAPKEPVIDIRDLKMAQAYGGLTGAQVEKLIQERKRKELLAQNQTQGMGQFNRPPINKNASNSRLGSMQSRRVIQQRVDDDNQSDWGGTQNNVIDGEGKLIGGVRGKMFGNTENQVSSTNRNDQRREHGKSQAKRTGGGYVLDIKKNNLMGSTQNSFKNGQDNHSSNQSFLPRQIGNTEQVQNPRERRLSNIANSVSGFYREQTLSEQSKMRSTHESHMAAPIAGGMGEKTRRQLAADEEEEQKQMAQNRGDNYDPEMDRIYGAAKGFGDISMMSDWEKDSNLSGQSGFTQLTGVNNNKKIRGLESIYLQRLEPASKGRATQQHGKKKKMNAEEKAKFRVMHDRVHDEPQYHLDENGQRDELDSVLSENYKQMERKFKEENKDQKPMRKKQAQIEEGNKPNIFHGNRFQYLEEKEKKRQQSMLDFEKNA